MSEKTESPTPEQLEAMKKTTAFAYGFALAMYGATRHTDYYGQIQHLRESLKELGCLSVGGWTVTDPYFESQMDGSTAAAQKLEAKNI